MHGKIEDARDTLYPSGVKCAALQTPAIRRAGSAEVNRQRVLVIEAGVTVSRDDIRSSLS
jgi:hypothetical protein